jgi:hypothetical protein
MWTSWVMLTTYLPTYLPTHPPTYLCSYLPTHPPLIKKGQNVTNWFSTTCDLLLLAINLGYFWESHYKCFGHICDYVVTSLFFQWYDCLHYFHLIMPLYGPLVANVTKKWLFNTLCMFVFFIYNKLCVFMFW